MDHLSENLPPSYEPPEALLVTGDALRHMPEAHIEAILKMLGGFGLTVTVVSNLEASQAIPEQSQPAVAPVCEADFLEFARQNGYTLDRALKAWQIASSTNVTNYPDGEGLPEIKVYSEEDTEYVDLDTVRQRLEKLDLIRPYQKSYGWHNGSGLGVQFLTHLCNTRLGSDIPHRS